MTNVTYLKTQLADLERDKTALLRSVENLLAAVNAAKAHVNECTERDAPLDATKLRQLLDVEAG